MGKSLSSALAESSLAPARGDRSWSLCCIAYELLISTDLHSNQVIIHRRPLQFGHKPHLFSSLFNRSLDTMQQDSSD